MIVFDCDAKALAKKLANEIAEAKNVRVFAFSKRAIVIAKDGIEDNFPARFLEEFKVISTSARTGKTTVSMSDEEKTAFAKHVNANGTKDHFEFFGEFEETVRPLLENKSRIRSSK